MALELSYVHVRLGEGRPRVESMSRPAPLSPPDLGTLLRLDLHTPTQSPPGDRALPLDDGTWAVGRGGFGGITWRIVPASDVVQMRHPAWLWRSSRWFDPTAPSRGPVPNALPLRSQLDPAARLGGSPSRTASLLAATVAAVRRKVPTALVIDPRDVADPAPSGRWFLLALMTLLPPGHRTRLRISTFEANPSPEDWDLVVVSKAPDGFVHLRPEDHPVLGGDIPATFVLDRLLSDDPEIVEAAAEWSDGAGADPWAEAIRRHRSSTEGTPAAPRRTATPGRRIASPRSQEGAPSRLRLNTPEAWLSLSDRSPEDRAEIVQAWLDRDDATPPTEAVLDAVAHIRPAGRDTERWCRALLSWADDGPSRASAARRLGEALDHEALPLEPSSRASLFTEYMQLLLDLGLFADALAAFSSTSASALIDSGAARVITEAWVQLPPSRRPESALRELVDRLVNAPDGDQALTHLWQALMVAERDARADLLLQQVARRAASEETGPLDALLDVLADSPQAMRWVGHVARTAPPELLWSLVAPVTSGPDDPLWEHCVDVRSQHAAPENRIADLVGLPEGQVARLERELRRVVSTVRVWRLPDTAVAEGAARLSGLPGASSLWMWLNMCASPPGPDPAGLLATIVDIFCTSPPANPEERRAAWAMAEALGAAEGWTPLQHAEILLRLAMAPDGDGTGFALDLSASVVRGVARRPGAPDHLADITDQLAALPPDHPALHNFLVRLLPLAFARGVPQAYVDAAKPARWPTPTREQWTRIVQSLGIWR